MGFSSFLNLFCENSSSDPMGALKNVYVEAAAELLKLSDSHGSSEAGHSRPYNRNFFDALGNHY